MMSQPEMRAWLKATHKPSTVTDDIRVHSHPHAGTLVLCTCGTQDPSWLLASIGGLLVCYLSLPTPFMAQLLQGKPMIPVIGVPMMCTPYAPCKRYHLPPLGIAWMQHMPEMLPWPLSSSC